MFLLHCDSEDCYLLFQPVLDDFHQAFEVVFVDPSGLVNLCADMTASKYHQVLGRLWWLLEMPSWEQAEPGRGWLGLLEKDVRHGGGVQCCFLGF